MTLEQLKAKMKEAAEKQQAIIKAAGGVDLSEEQAAQFDALQAECEKLKGMISRAESAAANEAYLSEVEPAVSENAGGPVHPGGPEAKLKFSCLGEFVHATIFDRNDQRLEMGESENHGPGFRIPEPFVKDLRGEHRMDDGPSGGFMVPEQRDNRILSVPTSPAVVRPRATVIPAGTPPDSAVSLGALDQSEAQNMYGGVVVSWIGEGESKPDTSARIKDVKLSPHEVAASMKVTDKLLRNWAASDVFLRMKLRGAMSAAEDHKFISGDGVAKPLGILGHDSAIKIARTTANRIKYEDLVQMEENLIPTADPVFLTTRKGVGQCRRLEDPEGNLIWVDGDASRGRPATLLGYPVILCPRMPTLGSLGDIMLVDLNYYLIKDGSGPFIAASEHVYWEQNKTSIKAFWNVDGAPWLNAPVMEENGELQSPFVQLDVPAA